MTLLIVLFLWSFLAFGIVAVFWLTVKFCINCSRKAKGLKPIKNIF